MKKINGYEFDTEFTPDQQREINEGIEAGLDVTVYAKPEFLAIQMREIRLGMLQKLPVERYAKIEYDWFQMSEIRSGLNSNLDVSKYEDPSIPFETMRQIRYGLEEGIDLSSGKKLPAGILKELRKSVKSKVDISEYIRQGYDEQQLEQIRIALEKGVDIAPYLSLCYRGAAIREICIGLEEKIDVSMYARTEMSWQQMREIRLGLEERLDAEIYANPFYSWQQMREIRLGLEDNLPVEVYSSLMYTAKQMNKKRLALIEKNKNAAAGAFDDKEQYGDFSLLVSSDAMKASVVLNHRHKKISQEEIIRALKNNGVTHGIDYYAIGQIGEGKAPGDIVEVARGKEPGKGKDGWYEYFFETDVKGQPKLLDDGSVDFQNIKWFEIVKTGQKIAVYHPAENGVHGYRVTGEIVQGQKGRELKLLTGKGFILLPDNVTYIAEIDGKIELNDNRLEITNVLVLDDVTLSTGNIDFNGSVYVRGTVGDGTVIKAQKDILCDGFIESAVLEAGGDIILKNGNNAGGQGYLKAGRDVLGSFFENAKVTAGQNIRANYCLNSELNAGNAIEIMGKNGMLAGGYTYASQYVKACNIGNEAGIATKIKLGKREGFAAYEAELADRESSVDNELLLLKNAYYDFQRKYPAEIRNANPIYLKLEDAVYTKETEAGRLHEERVKLESDKRKYDRAKAVARGTVFPGTSMDINGVIWNAKRVKNVTVKKIGGSVSVHSNI